MAHCLISREDNPDKIPSRSPECTGCFWSVFAGSKTSPPGSCLSHVSALEKRPRVCRPIQEQAGQGDQGEGRPHTKVIAGPMAVRRLRLMKLAASSDRPVTRLNTPKVLPVQVLGRQIGDEDGEQHLGPAHV
jgi:hypothetical protein